MNSHGPKRGWMRSWTLGILRFRSARGGGCLIALVGCSQQTCYLEMTCLETHWQFPVWEPAAFPILMPFTRQIWALPGNKCLSSDNVFYIWKSPRVWKEVLSWGREVNPGSSENTGSSKEVAEGRLWRRLNYRVCCVLIYPLMFYIRLWSHFKGGKKKIRSKKNRTHTALWCLLSHTGRNAKSSENVTASRFLT